MQDREEQYKSELWTQKWGDQLRKEWEVKGKISLQNERSEEQYNSELTEQIMPQESRKKLKIKRN